MDDLKSAHYWRKRAAETRWTADRAQDQALKQTMLRVAMTYDRLAGARVEPEGRHLRLA